MLDENVLIEKVVKIAFDFCSFKTADNFRKQIDEQLTLESSLDKKIRFLEKLLDENAKLLRKTTDLEKFQVSNLSSHLLEIIYSRKKQLKKWCESYETTHTTYRELNYYLELSNIIEFPIDSLEEFKEKEIHLSKKPFRTSPKRLKEVEKSLFDLKAKSHKEIQKLNDSNKDISGEIWSRIENFEYHLNNLYDYLISEVRKEPVERQQLSDVDGESYINPINYFIDHSTYNLTEYKIQLTEIIEQLNYEVYSDALNSVIESDNLWDIKLIIEKKAEVELLHKRLSELTAGKYYVPSTSFTQKSIIAKRGLILTTEAARNHGKKLTQLCKLLVENDFIEKINGHIFSKVFSDKVLSEPSINWKKQIGMLYFMKLLFSYKIIEENEQNRFPELKNIFLVKGKAITPKKIRSLSSQYVGMENDCLKHKTKWQEIMDNIFDTVFS